LTGVGFLLVHRNGSPPWASRPWFLWQKTVALLWCPEPYRGSFPSLRLCLLGDPESFDTAWGSIRCSLIAPRSRTLQSFPAPLPPGHSEASFFLSSREAGNGPLGRRPSVLVNERLFPRGPGFVSAGCHSLFARSVGGFCCVPLLPAMSRSSGGTFVF